MANYNFTMNALRLFLLFVSVSADTFDDVKTTMDSVNADNCQEKSEGDLRLHVNIATDQSSIQEAQTLALNRAFFFSGINQILNRSMDFVQQPDLVYHYLSSAASVSSSYFSIIGAGIYYDFNTTYANWYHSVPFNYTLRLFAPYTMRDLSEPGATRDPLKFEVKDDSVRNYPTWEVETNFWYDLWLPDNEASSDSITKGVYSISGSDAYGGTFSSGFFGVAGSELVSLTHLYFDCGRTKQWVITAAAPVVDYLVRYMPYIHLRRPRFSAVSTVDVDFNYVDINPCDISEDNPPPNTFAGIHKCKASTECKPVKGYGFRRGGYQCVCKPGYVYPANTPGPYQGQAIEEASEPEYADGFECVQSENGEGGSQSQHSTSENNANILIINSASERDCASPGSTNTLPAEPRLHSRIAVQSSAAVRLAQFLSSILQTSFDLGWDSNLTPMKGLNRKEVLAEVVANVLADDNIAAGKAVLKTLTVGQVISSVLVQKPRDQIDTRKNLLVEQELLSEDFFNVLKSNVWPQSFESSQYTVDPWMKADPRHSTLYEVPDWNYTAPEYRAGIWGRPEFSCNLGQWVVNFSMPILGPNEAGTDVEFRGQTSVLILVPASVLRDVYSGN